MPTRSRLSLWGFLLAACSDGPSATARVELSGEAYSGAVESRASLTQDGRYRLTLVTSIDRDEDLADDELYFRFDAEFIALRPTRFALGGLARVESGLAAVDPAVEVRCTVQEPGPQDEPNLFSACLSELIPLAVAPRVVTERLDGVLRIERVQARRLSGWLTLHVVGVAEEGTQEEEQSSNPLFQSGVRLELPFEVELPTR